MNTMHAAQHNHHASLIGYHFGQYIAKEIAHGALYTGSTGKITVEGD